MNRLQQSRIFLIAAILLIVAFQAYWLNRLYKEEGNRLQKEAGTVLRDVVYNLQVEKVKADTLIYKQTGPNLLMYNTVNAFRRERLHKEEPMSVPEIPPLVDSLMRQKANFIFFKKHDSLPAKFPVRVEIRRHSPSPETDSALLNSVAKNGKLVIVNIGQGKNDTISISGSAKPLPPAPVVSPGVTVTLRKHDTTDNKKETINIKTSGFTDRSFVKMVMAGRALDDSLSSKKLDSAYTHDLAKAGMPLAFRIKKVKDEGKGRRTDSITGSGFRTPPVPVGFNHAYWYHAEFDSPALYILRKISPQILFSFFLIAFTSLAFIFLYRNLLAQRRLTAIKNDFIGNVTHELKTPIATVNVALEALRNFGGLDNPARTREYLDISAAELQRLSLLVDKVLKLSMFEKEQIALQKEPFDLLQLINEVMTSMKLQFEKQKAVVTIDTEGDNFMIDADRMHITSVIYNLLDNALKYSKENPVIGITLIRLSNCFEFRVSDNGIGIPDAYHAKIFDRFFRVPTGNRHNIKGYGLGLSYVNHIVQRHHGKIELISETGKGSTFIVKLPFTETGVIN